MTEGQKDVFFRACRRYDDYHAQKDQLVWLPAAAYLVFVGAVISALATHPELLNGFFRWGVAECLGVVCALVVAFLCVQNGYKISASVISDRLDRLALRFDAGQVPTALDVYNAIHGDQPRAEKAGRGTAGYVLIVLTVFLGVAQVLFVIFLDP